MRCRMPCIQRYRPYQHRRGRPPSRPGAFVKDRDVSREDAEVLPYTVGTKIGFSSRRRMRCRMPCIQRYRPYQHRRGRPPSRPGAFVDDRDVSREDAEVLPYTVGISIVGTVVPDGPPHIRTTEGGGPYRVGTKIGFSSRRRMRCRMPCIQRYRPYQHRRGRPPSRPGAFVKDRDVSREDTEVLPYKVDISIVGTVVPDGPPHIRTTEGGGPYRVGTKIGFSSRRSCQANARRMRCGMPCIQRYRPYQHRRGRPPSRPGAFVKDRDVSREDAEVLPYTVGVSWHVAPLRMTPWWYKPTPTTKGQQ